jgi:hypothetical protein
MNTLLNLLILIVVFWFGFDLIVRGTCGPQVHQSYRRVTTWILSYIRRQIYRFAAFTWGRYRQFVLGAVSMFLFLLLTGRLVV